MSENDVTATPESLTDIPNEVSSNHINTEPSDSYCSSHISFGGESATTSAITSIPINNAPQTPLKPNLEKPETVNSLQQCKLFCYNTNEERDTVGYDSDGVLGPCVDALDNKGE